MNLFKHAVAGIAKASNSNIQRKAKETESNEEPPSQLNNKNTESNGGMITNNNRRNVWTKTKKRDETTAQKSIFSSAIMAACKPTTKAEISIRNEVNFLNGISKKNHKRQSPPPPKSNNTPEMPKKIIEPNEELPMRANPTKTNRRQRALDGSINKVLNGISKKKHERHSPAPIPPKIKNTQKMPKKKIIGATEELPTPPPPKVNNTPDIQRKKIIGPTEELPTPPPPKVNNTPDIPRKKIIGPIEELPMHASPTKTPRRQRALDGSMSIAPFFTKAYIFSNHFQCYFYVDERRFSCTEQFYMFYKARVFGDTQSANEIMRCAEARDMKRIGSRIRHFDTRKWRQVSILVMTIANMAKYSQNKELRKLLFETGDSVLVEASPDDIYWGVGISVDSASIRDVQNWPGKNVLGRILTRIREVLKEKPEFRNEWESRRQTI